MHTKAVLQLRGKLAEPKELTAGRPRLATVPVTCG